VVVLAIVFMVQNSVQMQRSWTGEDGRAHSVVEVVADELGPSLRWATATTPKTTRSHES
jgi:hypothetical protein